MRPHPALVDANAVIEDVLRRCRGPFTAMTFLPTRGFITLLAPTHVHGEVGEHLPRVAAMSGCSMELAMHVWETVYLPLIRFVDIPAADLDDGRVRAVDGGDGDDTPFARLSLLMAPSVALTRDRHLTSAGIGDPDWLQTLLILGDLAELESTIWGGSRLLVLCAYLPVAGVANLGRQIMRSELALAFVLGLAVGTGLFLRPQLRAAASATRERLGPAVGVAIEATSRGFEHSKQTEAALHSRLVAVDAPPTAEMDTARLLAEQDQPRSSADIHAHLQQCGYGITLTGTRTMLRNHPSFVAVSGRGFQLGRYFAVAA